MKNYLVLGLVMFAGFEVFGVGEVTCSSVEEKIACEAIKDDQNNTKCTFTAGKCKKIATTK